jgi:excinuclease ABC subunit C
MDNTLSFDAKHFLKKVVNLPGVYQMFDKDNNIIYVGKAKNLKKRISTYFNRAADNKTLKLVQKIKNIKTIVCQNESEALLLEGDLIKKYQPYYNILFKDGKTYPFIAITKHKYPQIKLYRGRKTKSQLLYGPYPNSNAAKEIITNLQQVFKLRTCENSTFNNRSRACLLYQIKLCTAPCVGLVSYDDYQSDKKDAIRFLTIKDDELINDLITKMQNLSANLAYEKAAVVRDKINKIQKIRGLSQVTTISTNTDIIAVSKLGNKFCVCVFYIRNGKNYGNSLFYPKCQMNNSKEDVLEAFLLKTYPKQDVHKIIIEQDLKFHKALEKSLKIKIITKPKKYGKQILNLAKTNAKISLRSFVKEKNNNIQNLKDIQTLLRLKSVPCKIECFDISHTAGSDTVASCVVFDKSGFNKSLYRKYNIKNIKPGDDYAAMFAVLQRRFMRLLKENKTIPDILLVDGGAGQLRLACDIISKFVVEDVYPIGLYKGEKRHTTNDTILLPDGKKISFIKNNGFKLLQQIRDEAHRFALRVHRKKRQKRLQKTILTQVYGLGKIRIKNLLEYFGGIEGIKAASVEQLQNAPTISKKIANEVYNYLHR